MRNRYVCPLCLGRGLINFGDDVDPSACPLCAVRKFPAHVDVNNTLLSDRDAIIDAEFTIIDEVVPPVQNEGQKEENDQGVHIDPQP